MLALALAVAPPPPATPVPQVVRIDVIATDTRGRTVTDLKPAEFELRDEGAIQPLDSARFVTAARADSTSTPAPIRSEFDEREQASQDQARLFAIYLDEYHVSAGANAARARDALTRFVETELRPDDLVAIMKPLDSVLAIRMTRDREAIHETIAGFEGRRGDYTPANSFEATYMGRAPDAVETLRTQVTLSALNALAIHLGRLRPGRKAMLIVTEALPARERRRGYEPLPDVGAIVRAANRYNVSLYPFDPGGTDASVSEPAAAVGRARGDEATLDDIARQTDGRVIASDAQSESGIRAMAGDSSAYYLLTYTATHPDDGRFHEVKVRIKRPDVTLRARSGYWALAPDETVRLRASDTEKLPVIDLGPRRTSPLIRPWFGLSRGGAAGRTRVTFVWESTPRVPGDRRLPPARIVLKAVDRDETVVFEGPVRSSGVAVDDAAARASFEVKPGPLHVRMTIEDATAKAIDFDTRDVIIRALDTPVVLGTPELLRARNAREFRELRSSATAVPVSAREFSRTERLLIRVVAYGPAGAEAPAVTARLLGRKGQAMRELPLAAADGTGRQTIDLPLAGLAAGEYAVELTATAPAGDARELLTFRVTG